VPLPPPLTPAAAELAGVPPQREWAACGGPR